MPNLKLVSREKRVVKFTRNKKGGKILQAWSIPIGRIGCCDCKLLPICNLHQHSFRKKCMTISKELKFSNIVFW